MQTLAVVRNQISLACLLVVPWLVGRAWFHRRENADQTGRVRGALRQNLFYAVFFAEVPLADEFDLNARFRRQLLRILANPVTERFGELRVVEHPDVSRVQYDVIPPAKQIPGNVPKISIRSQQPNTPAICAA